MVQFKRNPGKKGVVYVSAYKGDKFLQYLGREDEITPERMNYIKRKWEGKIK